MNELNLLRIDASARENRSLSRALGDRFVREWQAVRPRDRVVRRDVGRVSPPPVSEAWIAAAFTPARGRSPEQRAVLAVSDTLIGELRAADVLVVATPMYNYGMPAALKAWVDQVVRVNETFSFDLARGDWPLRPTLSGKPLFVLTSSGEFGFRPGEPRAQMEHLVSHFRTLAPYFGADEIFHVAIEYQEFGDERHRRSVDAAHKEVARIVKEFAERRDASKV